MSSSLVKSDEWYDDAVELALDWYSSVGSDVELLWLDPSPGAESGRVARRRDAIDFEAGRANGFEAGRGEANGCEAGRGEANEFEGAAGGRGGSGRGGSE